MTRLPEPFLPLHDSDIKRLAKLVVYRLDSGLETVASSDIYTCPGLSVVAKAGNRMGTARRCNLAKLLCTLRGHQNPRDFSNPEGVQILTRVSLCYSINTSLTHLNLPSKITDLLPGSRLPDHFHVAVVHVNNMVEKSSQDSLILPDDFIEELKRAGLLQ